MKQLRIGILTFHRSINYGAVMQCYALQQQLKSDFPNDIVEVIDYIPKNRYKFYKPTLRNYLFSNWRYINRPLVRLKVLWGKITHLRNLSAIKKRYKTFQESLKILNLSKDFFCTDEPEVFRKSVNGKYDVIVVGSDCVWEWTILGIPSAYYLCGSYNAHKMSYAACSGVNDYRDLDSLGQEYLKRSWGTYDYIGVRDSTTAFNVENLCSNVKVHRNCDPTTLINPDTLDLYRQHVKKILDVRGIDWSKPVIGLMCNEIIGELAYSIFGDSVQYVGVYNPNKYATVFLHDLVVLEWASIFGLFSMTFTTFFHGTMLSLVNRTPVLSFDYYEGDEDHLSKIEELYRRLDLPGYYHKGKQSYNKDELNEIDSIARTMINTPQSDMIDAKIKAEATSYQSFYQALKELHY